MQKTNRAIPTLTSTFALFITLSLSIFAFPSFAQNNQNSNNVIYSSSKKAKNTQSFGGFYTQAGLGYQSFSPNVSTSNYSVGGGATYASSTQVSSSQGLSGTVTAGYDFTVSPEFLLGIGAELSPLAGKSTSVGGTTVDSTPIPASSYKVNSSYNLFVSPIFPLDKMTALYGKLGYSKANVSSGPNLNSLNYSGYSLGLGYKTIISGNLYAYVEGNYFNYGKVNDSGTAIIPGSSTSYSYSNSSTATSYNLLYGIGMRF